nr:formylglycine-generating enzyme family protein [Acinetobacter sp. Marseille-Q1620]
MKLVHLVFLNLSCIILFGCSNSNSHETHQKSQTSAAKKTESVTEILKLGNLTECKQYSGLPKDWLTSPHAGMVSIPAGQFELGSELAYQDEQNFGQKKRNVPAFWIDQTEVTVAQFQTFVDATGYVTDAEKQKTAAVFNPAPEKVKTWWQLKSGYTWRTPNGLHGQKPLPHEPVRYVTLNDAENYAVWLGREIPTEIEWEYAAKAGQNEDVALHHQPRDHQHHPQANYWQGEFPTKNLLEDGFEGIAPAGCFKANAFGLYDMIGNVWEWTTTPYQGAHDMHLGNPSALRQSEIKAREYVIKGGSFLCADNYCARFRNSARYPQETDLAITHVGFRTILRGS